jgi:hypothetical protein
VNQRGLLVACGEPALREALAGLEDERFAGQHVERLLLPGGCWWLAEAAAMTSGRLKRMVLSRSSTYDAVVDFIADRALSGVALVAHQDCAWYRARFPRLSAGELVKRAGADLYTARDEVLRLADRDLSVTGTVLVLTGERWEPRTLF